MRLGIAVIYANNFQNKQKEQRKYDSQYRIEVLRHVTKEEIEQYPVRWRGYEPGDTTNAFYTEKEAFEQAAKIAKARFGKGWVFDFEQNK